MPPDPPPPPPDPPPPPPPYWAAAVPTTPCSSKMPSTDTTLFDMGTPSLRRGQLRPLIPVSCAATPTNITRALARLPGPQRQALELLRLAGLPVDVAATRAGTTVGAL